jgi:membrane peptidoglycan carboxypeptidase
MAKAYAVFIGGGIACRPSTITSGIRADSREKIETPNPDCHQAISPAVANTVADTLRQPFAPGGTLGELGGLSGREAGAKTGTTNDYAANWIVGFTPQYSSAVWLGDPRGGNQYPLDVVHAYGREYRNLTGSEVAAPVWKDLMTRISAGLPSAPLPKGDDAAGSATTAKAIPDIRGLSVNDAVTLLMQNDLTPKVAPTPAPASPLYGKEVVVSQVPAPGSPYGYKQGVEITLSAGSETAVRIPDKK